MTKFTFGKGAKKTAQKQELRPISKTDISKSQETYDPTKLNLDVETPIKETTKKRPGRPKSGRKSYQTIRLQKSTVMKINALEGALAFDTQDETVGRAIERLLNSLSSDEKRAYRLWLDMFEKKEGK